MITHIIFQVTALLKTLEFQESASSNGHFALYNCLVLGHTKYNGVQRIYCNTFPGEIPAKPFHSSHCLWSGSLASIMPPLLFCQILYGMLGFCFCSQHLQWLTLDPSPANAHLYQRWKHVTILRMVTIITIISIITLYVLYSSKLFRLAGICQFPGPLLAWLQEPILYVIPVESILDKLPVIPVGDTGTIQHNIHNLFTGAPGDRQEGSWDRCRMWFVN